MIPILFDALATDFSTFGIGHLSDAIDPQVVEERNGEFTLTLSYPLFGEHFESIGMRSIILAKPSPAQDPQPFRVFRITKPINGIVTINARHVRYDLEGVPVTPFTAVGIVNALNAIKSNAIFSTPFTFSTNKTNTQTMTLTAPSSAISLLGGVRGSLLDVYGGEYKYNIWNVALLSARGANNGVVIRYGVDLTDFQQEENCANVYTGVLCYWQSTQDGTTVTGQVQASGTFDYERVLVVDKSADYESTPTVAQLNQDAIEYIYNNKVGVPKVSINLSFANLEQTEEYKNIRQSIELCDQITVEFAKIGVSAVARINRTVFDVINEVYISVDIGDTRTSLADSFIAVQTKADNAPTTTEMKQAIVATTAAITGANGGAVRLLDTNDDDLPDTLYIADNPSPLLASKVWRFNYEGWGASQNGYSGPFTMGATFAQGFIADFITAGTLNADRIGANSISVSKLTGKIKNGGWNIDLDAGTFTIGTISADNITAGTIDASKITVTNLNADNITVGTINGSRITDLSIEGGKIQNSTLGGSKLADFAITETKIDNKAVSGSKIKDLTITGSNIADTTLPGDKLENYTLNDLQMQSGGLSTWSTSDGIDRSLGYADFSNSVFNSATRCNFLYCEYLDVGTTGRIDAFSATSLSVYYGGSYYSATFQTPSVSLTHSSAFTVLDTNGNTQWVSNVTAASLGSFVLAH